MSFLIHWQDLPKLKEFVQNFTDQVTSDGSVEAMAGLQQAVHQLQEVAHKGKVHIIEVFLLKALKQIKDGKDNKAADQASSEVNNGMQVLQKQFSEISSGALGLKDGDVCPFLLHEGLKELK